MEAADGFTLALETNFIVEQKNDPDFTDYFSFAMALNTIRINKTFSYRSN
ncbi:hypothetical protein VCHE16_2240 [Vibrio paracholerae HE-16]|nr:hypothetical protein VCHE16_2240 [Vibrio paracholerae HE-16]